MNILQRLAGVRYLILTDASTGYHNLKISSYCNIFSCAFGRYRYI